VWSNQIKPGGWTVKQWQLDKHEWRQQEHEWCCDERQEQATDCWQADWLDCIEQCFTSPPTQYRIYGSRFLQVKRPNQQYRSTERTNSTQTNQTYNKQTWTQNTAGPLVYNNMGWLGDGSHRGQGCQAWTAVGLPPRYPQTNGWKTETNRQTHSDTQRGTDRLIDRRPRGKKAWYNDLTLVDWKTEPVVDVVDEVGWVTDCQSEFWLRSWRSNDSLSLSTLLTSPFRVCQWHITVTHR